MAPSTVVTTTGTGHAAVVRIEPEYRTKIRTYVTEHKVRPVETREKIVVGRPVPKHRVRGGACRLGSFGQPVSAAMSTRARA